MALFCGWFVEHKSEALKIKSLYIFHTSKKCRPLGKTQRSYHKYVCKVLLVHRERSSDPGISVRGLHVTQSPLNTSGITRLGKISVSIISLSSLTILREW